MELPLSPSLSESPTATVETQAPIPSIRDSLPGYGISIEIVQVMGHEDFWKLVAAIDIQSRLRSSNDQKSTCLCHDFDQTLYKVLQPDTIIYRIHTFMAYCLLHLIKLAQTSKAEPQKQKNVNPSQKCKLKVQEQNNKSLGHKEPLL
ncbi:unnamed protein product [Diplocarpon coronariae]